MYMFILYDILLLQKISLTTSIKKFLRINVTVDIIGKKWMTKSLASLAWSLEINLSRRRFAVGSN